MEHGGEGGHVMPSPASEYVMGTTSSLGSPNDVLLIHHPVTPMFEAMYKIFPPPPIGPQAKRAKIGAHRTKSRLIQQSIGVKHPIENIGEAFCNSSMAKSMRADMKQNIVLAPEEP